MAVMLADVGNKLKHPHSNDRRDRMILALDGAEGAASRCGGGSAGQNHDSQVLSSFSDGPHDATLDAIIISDIHLGCENCQARTLCRLLEDILEKTIAGYPPTRRLIINGDVFDSIDFRRLKKTHWKVLSMLRHLSDKIEVVWTCGNHDGPAEIVSHLLGVQVLNEYMLESGGKRMLVMHGHVFDDFIDHHPVLTWLGDQIYNVLQRVDRRHYVARLAKARSKVFLHCLDKVQARALTYAAKMACQAVICGHTHRAAAVAGPIAYFNSGCWTEVPCTYLEVGGGQVHIRTAKEAAHAAAAAVPPESQHAAEGQPSGRAARWSAAPMHDRT